MTLTRKFAPHCCASLPSCSSPSASGSLRALQRKQPARPPPRPPSSWAFLALRLLRRLASLLFFLLACVTYTYLSWLEQPTSKSLSWLVIFALALLYTNFMGWPFLAALGVDFLFRHEFYWRAHWSQLAIAIALLVTAYAPVSPVPSLAQGPRSRNLGHYSLDLSLQPLRSGCLGIHRALGTAPKYPVDVVHGWLWHHHPAQSVTLCPDVLRLHIGFGAGPGALGRNQSETRHAARRLAPALSRYRLGHNSPALAAFPHRRLNCHPRDFVVRHRVATLLFDSSIARALAADCPGGSRFRAVA